MVERVATELPLADETGPAAGLSAEISAVVEGTGDRFIASNHPSRAFVHSTRLPAISPVLQDYVVPDRNRIIVGVGRFWSKANRLPGTCQILPLGLATPISHCHS
jgi:hypothetical protein